MLTSRKSGTNGSCRFFIVPDRTGLRGPRNMVSGRRGWLGLTGDQFRFARELFVRCTAFIGDAQLPQVRRADESERIRFRVYAVAVNDDVQWIGHPLDVDPVA